MFPVLFEHTCDMYLSFQPSCLTLNTLFGITSMKPMADYYPFFAPMLQWKWLNPLWPGTVWFGIFYYGVGVPESTGGDAPAAAAPAAPGAELMSGKKSHDVRCQSWMRSVCREHVADISQKYFHFSEKHCARSHGCVTRQAGRAQAEGWLCYLFNSGQCRVPC